jgi:hypothetical protein
MKILFECDKCRHKWQPTAILLANEDGIPVEVVSSYFTQPCPKCGFPYGEAS